MIIKHNQWELPGRLCSLALCVGRVRLTRSCHSREGGNPGAWSFSPTRSSYPRLDRGSCLWSSVISRWSLIDSRLGFAVARGPWPDSISPLVPPVFFR